MAAFAQPCQPNSLVQDTDDVPAAMWRPLFRNVPALSPIAPDARPMRDQMAHLGQLMKRLPATADETALVAQAYQLCERTHGYPAIGAALEHVTRLLADALVAMHLGLTAIAGARGYPNAGAWAGTLVEAQARIPLDKRRFPLLAAVTRAGSPNIEFEDVERGVSSAQVLGVIPHDASGEGDSQPFIALAAAVRQHRKTHLIEELERCATTKAAQPEELDAYIAEVACIAQAHGFALPVDWRWFVLMRHRAGHRRRVDQRNAMET